MKRIAVLLLAVLMLAHASGVYAEQRGTLSEDFGRLKRIEYGGVTYVRKTDVTTLLLMGIDRESGVPMRGYRNGGQADFLMLAVIDGERGTVSRLAIDRDTVADFDVLTVMGQPGGTVTSHLSLSHGFGASDEACCENTVKAVENLLGGEKIDLYMAVNMDKVGYVNDMLGGIEMTIDADMTKADPELIEGTVVRLRGEQAEAFVRARMLVGDGSNAGRMARQETFLAAMAARLRECVREDTDFIGVLYDGLGDALCTNLSRGRLINIANRAWKYEMKETMRLRGEYTLENGFTAFHAEQDGITEWVVSTLYH